MESKEKCEEAIKTILEIDELYEIKGKKILIEHNGCLLNKRQVNKIIEGLANKNDDSDYWAFLNKLKRQLEL